MDGRDRPESTPLDYAPRPRRTPAPVKTRSPAAAICAAAAAVAAGIGLIVLWEYARLRFGR